MALTITSEPPVEPVSLDEFKDHARIDGSDEDTLANRLIAAARKHLEKISGRAFVQQTLALRLDNWPDEHIALPRPPFISLGSIQYIDGEGSTQSWASSDYQIDSFSEPARIKPAYGGSWPGLRSVFNPITVTWDAGYVPGEGSPTDYAENVPEDLRHAVMLLAAHWFENREQVVVGNYTAVPLPMAVDALIAPFRIHWGSLTPVTL